LVETEDFKVGNKESAEYIIGWTNQIIVPAWTAYRFYFTSVASENAYRIVLLTTGLKDLTTSIANREIGVPGMQAYGTKFGDYVKQWNLDHPNDHLKHDTGTLKGQDIVPLYYTRSKYN
jgi:hypothetical protein